MVTHNTGQEINSRIYKIQTNYKIYLTQNELTEYLLNSTINSLIDLLRILIASSYNDMHT